MCHFSLAVPSLLNSVSKGQGHTSETIPLLKAETETKLNLGQKQVHAGRNTRMEIQVLTQAYCCRI